MSDMGPVMFMEVFCARATAAGMAFVARCGVRQPSSCEGACLTPPASGRASG